MLPAVEALVIAEIAVPDQAGPVEFEALDVEFRGHVFEEKGGTNVRDGVEEPGNDVSLRTDINGKRLETEGLRRDQHAVAFGAARVLAQPGFGFGEVARKDNGIAVADIVKRGSCSGHVEIE